MNHLLEGDRSCRVRNKMKTLEATITCTESITAIDLLASATQLSRSNIKRSMNLGAVWIQKKNKVLRLRRAKANLKPGDRVSIYYNETILTDLPPSPILIDDQESYTIWHKPSGLMSSGTRFGDHFAINRVVEKLIKRAVFVVHRLDKFASGIMVLAHTKSAAAHLSQQFRQRDVEKKYKAIVEGQLINPVSSAATLDGKDAMTRIYPLENNSMNTLVEVSIDTGRKHQIRRHLSILGFPVVGDRQYGNSTYSELVLTAVSLTITCPNSGERIQFNLPQANHPHLADLKV